MDKKYVSLNNLASYDIKIKEYISSLLSDSLAQYYPVDTIYPIGSIYMSASPISPSTIFGGTWEQIKDMFLLACGDSYAAGDTGGESEHTLTVEEIPPHNHTLKTDLSGSTTWAAYTSYVGGWSQYPFAEKTAAGETTYEGGGVSHNNMPPYLAVYVWKRTG